MGNKQMINQIKWWHYKAGEDDFFSKYIFQYLAFIGYIQRIKYMESTDRRAIQRLKRDSEIRDEYLKLIWNNERILQSWISIQQELDARPLWQLTSTNEVIENTYWNFSEENIREKTEENKWKASWVIHDLNDWENMVEYWYSIRNTLFHWWKDINSERDNLLVEHWYKTLRPLVELLLDE